MKGIAQRLAIRLEDAARYGPILRGAIGRGRLLADRLAKGGGAQEEARRIVQLCGAARLAADSPLMGRIERRLNRRLERLDATAVNWSEFIHCVDDRRIAKGAIIKPWVGPREKGVIFISFEDQWARLLCCDDLRGFAQRYDLVVAPTWCPPHSLVNAAFPRVYPDPFVCLISNAKDLQTFPRLSPKYLTVPLYASSWVNPAFYAPRPRDRRDIDIVMIANFGKYKRHHALFRAMRRMRSDVRAVLIGQAQGSRNAETVRREAELYGMGDRVSIHSSVSNEFLAEALCRAKVSVILSRREGSCVAVVESMIADTPVGLLADAEVGSRAFVHVGTGRLLRGGRLAEDLQSFIDEAAGMSPRAWAVANVSCHPSTRTLNAFLRDRALGSGRAWTRDIETVYWRPDPEVEGDDADGSLRRERDHLREVFGFEIGGFPARAGRPRDVVPAEPPPVLQPC